MTSKTATRMPSTAARLAPMGHAVAALAMGVWRFVVAIRGRRELAHLTELDDHMLADIGLMRADVSDAYAEPPWREPTRMLARRAAERYAVADEQPSSPRLKIRLTACAAHRPIDQSVTRNEIVDDLKPAEPFQSRG